MPSKPTRKLSPLLVANGFVHGWAFDRRKATLELVLTLDGIEAGTGLTGFPVDAALAAGTKPPTANCGFCLPLPRAARDGRSHNISIAVREWQTLPKPATAALTWHDGGCFGEVVKTAEHYEGWVGFRQALGNRVPDILVSEGAGMLSEGSRVRHIIQPTVEARTSIDGSRALIKFRVAQESFADIRGEPAFSCEGRTLALKYAAPRYKVGGAVTRFDADGIRGWIFNAANPRDTLDVLLFIDDLPHSVHRPNELRPDIARHLKLKPEDVGICGFNFSLPAVLKDGKRHTLALRCKASGTLLNSEPLTYQHKKAGFSIDETLALQTTLDPGLRRGDERRRSREGGNPVNVATHKEQITACASGFLKHPKPKVSIIILNRNGAPLLNTLFTSFQTHNTVPVEWIVIDHDSSDNSLDLLEHWRHRLPLRIVALQENHSFSSSCNRGAALAKAPALLFLNNDIVWLQDALPRMLESLTEKKMGAVGLRLLKSEFADDAIPAPCAPTSVQHLGIRFTLVGDQYWPYEVTPEHAPLEQQHSPQHMAAVTGAVLLCKRKVFLDAGGFDERYFYGYEDVDLCLRLRAKGLGILCRNDLTALHHHGYTRLSGREPGVTARLAENQQHLAAAIGPRIKQQYWRSLVAGDGIFAGETLTIGFAIEGVDQNGGTEQLAAAREFALALKASHPRYRVVFLPADSEWTCVDECHVVVALSAYYDLRNLRNARADLRTAIFVYDAAAMTRWAANPSLSLFHRCLFAADGLKAKTLKELRPEQHTQRSMEHAPLGDLLASDFAGSR